MRWVDRNPACLLEEVLFSQTGLGRVGIQAEPDHGVASSAPFGLALDDSRKRIPAETHKPAATPRAENTIFRKHPLTPDDAKLRHMGDVAMIHRKSHRHLKRAMNRALVMGVDGVSGAVTLDAGSGPGLTPCGKDMARLTFPRKGNIPKRSMKRQGGGLRPQKTPHAEKHQSYGGNDQQGDGCGAGSRPRLDDPYRSAVGLKGTLLG